MDVWKFQRQGIALGWRHGDHAPTISNAPLFGNVVGLCYWRGAARAIGITGTWLLGAAGAYRKNTPEGTKIHVNARVPSQPPAFTGGAASQRLYGRPTQSSRGLREAAFA
ncbi:hypothetical protein [Xylella fastidiosa]|uniref:hypothetical protein n=1 Tax=Xylella fastidiosa TaxID=2371 RepID=UPI003AFAC08B